MSSRSGLRDLESEFDHINYHFRQEMEHKYAWDEDTLARTLRQFWFNDLTRREFDPALDTESRNVGTLYMKASKRN